MKLPVEERLAIVDKIWASIAEDVPDNDDEISVAKERYEDYQKNPNSSLDWKDVKNQLFEKYGFENKDSVASRFIDGIREGHRKAALILMLLWASCRD